MNPERNRRAKLDRTRHDEERASRARQRGPTADQISDALEAVGDHDVPGKPPLAAARVLLDGVSFPVSVGSRTLTGLSIREGDPVHGAKRTDDHISTYQVELPLSEVGTRLYPPAECEHCGGTRAEYHTNSWHFEAGSTHLHCLSCDEALFSEEW